MSSESVNQNSADDQRHDQHESSDRSSEPPNIIDPQDLVYKGGFSKDPQEILGNPAVAPQTLTEGRDLRVDLFRDAEEAEPTQDK